MSLHVIDTPEMLERGAVRCEILPRRRLSPDLERLQTIEKPLQAGLDRVLLPAKVETEPTRRSGEECLSEPSESALRLAGRGNIRLALLTYLSGFQKDAREHQEI